MKLHISLNVFCTKRTLMDKMYLCVTTVNWHFDLMFTIGAHILLMHFVLDVLDTTTTCTLYHFQCSILKYVTNLIWSLVEQLKWCCYCIFSSHLLFVSPKKNINFNTKNVWLAKITICECKSSTQLYINIQYIQKYTTWSVKLQPIRTITCYCP